MSLLEVVHAYRRAVKADGKKAADRWLVEIGVHHVIRRALQTS